MQAVSPADLLECQSLVSLFFRHLDGGALQHAADLFAPDGVWIRQGKPLQGPDGLMREFGHRSTTVTVRHVVSSLALVPESAETVTAYFVLTVYRHDDRTGGGPAPLDGPELVRDATMKLRRLAAGWRIHHLSAKTVFDRNHKT